ncbi:MAG TPA: methyltransferase domain-containing protein, partial [Usitatibacter sp.]|nr:methyltransferase domain-containing protein [Usitatibacter sp.]
MVAARTVEPEWLDTLAPEDPRAQRSRRDLARLNAIMRNAGIVARELRGIAVSRIAEIGAGDGAFAVRLAGQLAGKGSFVLLDRQPAALPAPRDGWRFEAAVRDAIDWLEDESTGSFDAIVANLFLHHFEDETLARLLAAIARRTPRFVACEPRRSALSLGASRLVGFVGCNDVTRHDAVASVRAGFRGDEISRLWRTAGWRRQEGS